MLSFRNMFSKNHLFKLNFIDHLKQNKFLIAHYSKIKLFVYVSVLCYLVVESDLIGRNGCIIKMPSDASKWFREPENCDICRDVNVIPKVDSDISPLEFYQKYAKIGKPVLVKGGAASWEATKVFSFNFLKDVYQTTDMNDGKDRNCQFFPYKTEFRHLGEVFNMTKERAELLDGEKSWYVGWSNCNNEAGQVLRSYYSKPSFLGNISENIALSWIFMGGPGDGAQMHVDNVYYPSWQAQLTGRKLWRLAPPPECYYVCQKQLDVIVEPGDIFVVNTNRWYHQTFVLPGSLSITIGSEFD